LPYELPLLLLGLPYLGELLALDRRRDKIAAGFLLLAASFAMLPGGESSDLYRLVRSLNLGTVVTDILLSHRSLGVLLVTAGVLLNGPVVLVGRADAPRERS